MTKPDGSIDLGIVLDSSLKFDQFLWFLHDADEIEEPGQAVIESGVNGDEGILRGG